MPTAPACECVTTFAICSGAHNSRLTAESQGVRVSHLIGSQQLGQVAQLVEHSTENVTDFDSVAQIGS